MGSRLRGQEAEKVSDSHGNFAHESQKCCIECSRTFRIGGGMIRKTTDVGGNYRSQLSVGCVLGTVHPILAFSSFFRTN